MDNDSPDFTKAFVIASVSRNDLAQIGDAAFAGSFSDEELHEIARAMRDRYYPDRFFEDLQEVLKAGY